MRCYLLEALKSFASVLCESDGQNQSEFCERAAMRLTALWLGHCDVTEACFVVERLCETCSDSVVRTAFSPLLYQLSSRLASGESEQFANALERLLLRLCDADPARAVLQLVALANGDNVSSGKGAEQFRQNLQALETTKCLASRQDTHFCFS